MIKKNLIYRILIEKNLKYIYFNANFYFYKLNHYYKMK